jgi:hypothetical protein
MRMIEFFVLIYLHLIQHIATVSTAVGVVILNVAAAAVIWRIAR